MCSSAAPAPAPARLRPVQRSYECAQFKGCLFLFHRLYLARGGGVAGLEEEEEGREGHG